MIGILGGTFDPVHFGHLRPALEVAEVLKLDEVRFIPCGQPPHREQPVASALQRLSLLRASIAGFPRFKVDDRELRREGPSYMVDTLASLQKDFPGQSLCLILGWDAFIHLEAWHQWQKIFEMANVVVTHRPGWSVQQIDKQSELGRLVEQKTVAAEKLSGKQAGYITFVAVTQLDISSTQIRQQLQQGNSVRYLLPGSVEQLILNQNIYR